MRRGNRMLDVGTGTGLLSLEARRRLGPDGMVVALDVSLDCLTQCREAARAEEGSSRLALVQADTQALPFPDSSFDAVTARSVLIYVGDRVRAMREFNRVLRPGGHASVFEPVNKEYAAPNVRPDDPALAPIRDAHDRVVSHMEARSEFMEQMSSFDERDLLRDFEAAGFEDIELVYEQRANTHMAEPWEAQTFISTRPDPGTMSYEEAAREVLGDDANAHLRRFAELVMATPYRLVVAWVFITATKVTEPQGRRLPGNAPLDRNAKRV
jgi:ubiquinone/menaquinone biosynthesis C-methylase UbiE